MAQGTAGYRKYPPPGGLTGQVLTKFSDEDWEMYWAAGGGGGGGVWGTVTGTLSDQLDLQAALDGKETAGAAAAAIAAHVGLADPHSQYLTSAEGNAAYEVIGAVAAHVALADPHTQYALESALATVAFSGSYLNLINVPLTFAPTAHATSHQNGGTDEINVGGLNGVLADPQPPIIGAGAAQAVAGNDARLNDSRAPNGSASGDLGGTYPGPTVTQARGLRETAGPTTLVVGAVTDGQFLKRVGATVVSAVPPDTLGADGDKGDITVGSAGTTLTIDANAVTDAKFRQGGARSVVGVTGNAGANTADIVGTTDQVLRVNGAGTALAFGAIDLSKVAAATGVLQAASFPALTGDVTTVAGALAATIGAAKVTRAMLNADAKNWQFLGQATASGAVRTGTITWTGTFKQLWFEYYISGYSNTTIGRLIVGPTAGLSETATNHCTSLIEGVTLTATSVSVPGWPTATTVNNVPRYGHMYVKNVAAAIKSMTGHGLHAGTAATVVPLQMRFAGLMSDATNAINKAELACYDAITGTVISTRTFNAGTYLNVWGRNDD